MNLNLNLHLYLKAANEPVGGVKLFVTIFLPHHDAILSVFAFAVPYARL